MVMFHYLSEISILEVYGNSLNLSVIIFGMIHVSVRSASSPVKKKELKAITWSSSLINS